MASMTLGTAPALGKPGPLSRTHGILVETMQLVEPRKEMPVPNHLLQSKIYSKVAQNSVVQARPSVLHFGGFELGKTHRQVLRLGNVSTEVQRMHVIPPQTKFFSIKYTKNERLVPGLTLDCVVEFTPDEWRYYYDCIRIHTKCEENLVVPIHAYPVMNTSEFPDHVDFPPVPIGHKSSHTIPLRCHAPIDFEFQLTYLQPHPAFKVKPMAGIIPANGDVNIEVTFTPTEFNTSYMKLQLVISQFNAKPLMCVFTGTSSPGLAKQLSEEIGDLEEDPCQLDPRVLSPIDRARRKKKKKNKIPTDPDGNLIFPSPQEVDRDGIRFPVNLDTPYAVGQVLNQEPGKLRAKDLREVVLAKRDSTHAIGSTRQMKEAMFENAVRQDVYEERQNQLRWQVKLGDDQISPDARSQILESRQEAWKEYKLKCIHGYPALFLPSDPDTASREWTDYVTTKHSQLQRGDPLEDQEFNRNCTECIFRRTIRDASKVGDDNIKFDTYTNDMWAVRHRALGKFTQAARKIIVRWRADQKIHYLRQTILDWGNKKFKTHKTVEEKEQEEENQQQEETLDDLIIDVHKVKTITFPTYAPPNVKDDMAVDALGVVPYTPTEVIVQKKVPYFNLKVPQHYKLMGYMSHNIHEAASNYVSPNLLRTLRTGANDEIITLPTPAGVEPPPEVIPVNEGDLKVEEVTETVTTSVPSREALTLKPPTALFKPIEYPSLHIFNPAPGLQVFQAPLPYAEVDADFHLCPLPRYTSKDTDNPHKMTQKHYLDRQDTIKGIMAWKKFPSQGLTSLSNTPTLTSVWVPRWMDPFGLELLSYDVPPLLNGLPAEDKQHIQELEEAGEEAEGEEAGHVVELTPDMVNAQFTLVDAEGTEEEKKEDMFPYGNKMPSFNIAVGGRGPVAREKREQELEFFMKKKYNRLGCKIQARMDHMNTLKTNPDLVLK